MINMYSWNDDTDKWKNASKIGGGYAFKSAKAPYLNKMAEEAPSGPRTYIDKPGPDMKLVSPLNRDLESLSADPIHIVLDGTASMQMLPGEFFDRAPLIGKTLYQYRPSMNGKQGTEISFCVVGDYKWDQWPLQIGQYGKGPAIEKILKALHAEGGGGPGIREGYELFAYFALNHIKTPNAQKPFLFVIGDEMFYPTLHPDVIKKHIGDTVQGPFDSMELWKEVANRYEVFFLRKPLPPNDDKIQAQWSEAIGSQRVIPVYDVQRVADVIMGAVALKWGEYTDFKVSLSARQDSAGIASVEKSLLSAPALLTSGDKPLLIASKAGINSKGGGGSAAKK